MTLQPPHMQEELGTYLPPGFLDRQERAYRAHTYLFKRIAKLSKQRREIDKSFTVLSPTSSDSNEEKVIKREALHRQLQIADQRLWDCEKTYIPMCLTLTTAIALYARDSCHTLTTTMLATLPGELRNLIYIHLFDTPLLVSLCLATLHKHRRPTSSRCCNHRAPCSEAIPPYLHPGVMEPTVLTEMLDAAMDLHARLGPVNLEDAGPGMLYFASCDASPQIERWFGDLHVEFDLVTFAKRVRLEPHALVPGRAAQVQEMAAGMLAEIPWRARRAVTVYVQVPETNYTAAYAALLVWLVTPGLRALKARGFKGVALRLIQYSRLEGWTGSYRVDGVWYSRLVYGNCHVNKDVLPRGERYIWQGQGYSIPECGWGVEGGVVVERNNAFWREYGKVLKDMGRVERWEEVEAMLNTMGEY
ncbi:hypothetical protein IQ07DRAFT_370340 [Pyrenochaeta sp. DS3sAY3a]|nr:hypothetical protein IQ07DRAFT_370340 [Pyrenochaeta sp. DS3sAY3a]